MKEDGASEDFFVRNRALRRGESFVVFCMPREDFSGFAANGQRGRTGWEGSRIRVPFVRGRPDLVEVLTLRLGDVLALRDRERRDVSAGYI